MVSSTKRKMVYRLAEGSAAMVDLLGGHSDAAINSIPQALPNIKSGKFILGKQTKK